MKYKIYSVFTTTIVLLACLGCLKKDYETIPYIPHENWVKPLKSIIPDGMISEYEAFFREPIEKYEGMFPPDINGEYVMHNQQLVWLTDTENAYYSMMGIDTLTYTAQRAIPQEERTLNFNKQNNRICNYNGTMHTTSTYSDTIYISGKGDLFAIYFRTTEKGMHNIADISVLITGCMGDTIINDTLKSKINKIRYCRLIHSDSLQEGDEHWGAHLNTPNTCAFYTDENAYEH